MAGIGFQLTKLMQRRTFAGGLQAYGYAALIGSKATVSLLPHKDHHLFTGTGAHLIGQQLRTWLKAQAND